MFDVILKLFSDHGELRWYCKEDEEGDGAGDEAGGDGGGKDVSFMLTVCYGILTLKRTDRQTHVHMPFIGFELRT